MSDWANQTELDFVAWLAELSANVEWRYERWLEDEHGNEEEVSYCPGCAEVEAAQQGTGVTVRGWDEARQCDVQKHCCKCDALLHSSPTRYMIEEEISWLETAQWLDNTDAAVLHNWLTGMGNYQRDKDWPLIAPHAIRLMRAAGVPVPEPGTIRFRPSDLLRGKTLWNKWNTLWLLAYEYVARKVVAFGDDCFDFLNPSAGYSSDAFFPLLSEEDTCRALARLFRQAGQKSDQGKFLATLGIKSWADLDVPIIIPDTRSEWPAGIFEVCGRMFREPAPNDCHPQARTVAHGELQFQTSTMRWCYQLCYGYAHDDPAWSVSLDQGEDQRLADFLAAVNPWLESLLEPDVEGSQSRLYRIRKKQCVGEAVRQLFWDGLSGGRMLIEDALLKINWHSMQDHCLDLTVDQRLETVLRWLAEDKAAADKSLSDKRSSVGRRT